MVPVLQMILKLKNTKQVPKVLWLLKVSELVNLIDCNSTITL